MESNAVYEFNWCELDQPIEVGTTSDYKFYNDKEALKFSDNLCKPNDYTIYNCTVNAISHPELGGIKAIRTKGFDYTIILESGTQIDVNAEEEPGKVHNGSQLTEWIFNVSVTINT